MTLELIMIIIFALLMVGFIVAVCMVILQEIASKFKLSYKKQLRITAILLGIALIIVVAHQSLTR